MPEIKVGTTIYAVMTPCKFEMRIPKQHEEPKSTDKTFDQLYSEAVNYGSNGRKSSVTKKKETESESSSEKPKGPVTTVSTQKFSVDSKTLIGFKSKVDGLPSKYDLGVREAEKAQGKEPTGSGIVDAERAVSSFKQFAAKELEKAVRDDVTGYDNCVAVLNRINEHAVLVHKVEFFLRRVEATEFSEGTKGKDGLWYHTLKLRRFYTTSLPTVSLLEQIIKNYLINDEVVSYNQDWKFRRGKKATTAGSAEETINFISMQKVGYESLSAIDRKISDNLKTMRGVKL